MYFCDSNINFEQKYQDEIDRILNKNNGGDNMKTQNGFTLMKGASEIKSFLNSKRVTRTVNKIQIHHMSLPNYGTWENTDKKKFSEPHFGRTNSLDSYGKNTWGSRDENGKYIAQHFNVFPDGYITSGRSLNSTPIGISGWNTGAICIEIYGNFDKGNDQMTSAQREAVIQLVGELCRRFSISPSENNLRYHAWFTRGGTYLGGYVPGKSTKTCPGTGFFGGNTMAAYKANFLPVIKQYLNGQGTVTQPKPQVPDNVTSVNQMVKVTTDGLNVRQEPNANSKIMTVVNKGDVFTIIKTSGKWGYLKSGAGWIHLGYTEPVKTIGSVTTSQSFKVKVTADVLNIRQRPDVNSSKVGAVTQGEVFTIVKTSGDWGYLKSGAGWINLKYTNRL